MEFRRLCLIEEGTVNSVVPSSSSSSSALADSGLTVEASPQLPSLVAPKEQSALEFTGRLRRSVVGMHDGFASMVKR